MPIPVSVTTTTTLAVVREAESVTSPSLSVNFDGIGEEVEQDLRQTERVRDEGRH